MIRKKCVHVGTTSNHTVINESCLDCMCFGERQSGSSQTGTAAQNIYLLTLNTVKLNICAELPELKIFCFVLFTQQIGISFRLCENLLRRQ